MKTLILIVVMNFGVFVSYAQDVKEADVPVLVKEAFTKKYPNLKAEWEKENGNYEAEYEGKRMSVNMETGKGKKVEVEGSVLISPDGTILETEEEIEASALPKVILEYIAKNVPDKKAKEASKITDKDGGVTYEIEVGKEEYFFDTNGAFIKKGDSKEEKGGKKKD